MMANNQSVVVETSSDTRSNFIDQTSACNGLPAQVVPLGVLDIATCTLGNRQFGRRVGGRYHTFVFFRVVSRKEILIYF
jgi:hypothetical protein